MRIRAAFATDDPERKSTQPRTARRKGMPCAASNTARYVNAASCGYWDFCLLFLFSPRNHKQPDGTDAEQGEAGGFRDSGENDIVKSLLRKVIEGDFST
jgi:hypothetical protein